MATPYKVFYPRLTISLQYVFQCIVDKYSYSYKDFEKIYNIFEDGRTHNVILCSSERNSVFVTENYDSEFVDIARNIFKEIVYKALGIKNVTDDIPKGLTLEYYCSSNREIINVSRLECVCEITFLTKESLNLFKLTNPEIYDHLVKFEKEMESYRKTREKRIKEDQRISWKIKTIKDILSLSHIQF